MPSFRPAQRGVRVGAILLPALGLLAIAAVCLMPQRDAANAAALKAQLTALQNETQALQSRHADEVKQFQAKLQAADKQQQPQCPPCPECPDTAQAEDDSGAGEALSEAETEAEGDSIAEVDEAVTEQDSSSSSGDGSSGGDAGGKGKGGGGFLLPPLDLTKLLGIDAVLDGLLYEPHTCFAPWNQMDFKSELRKALLEKLQAAVTAVVKRLADKRAVAAAGKELSATPFLDLLAVPDESHPKFVRLRAEMDAMMANYMLHSDGSRHCVCGAHANPGNPINSTADVGASGCKDGQKEQPGAGAKVNGGIPGALLSGGNTIEGFVIAVEERGMCTSRYPENYGSWWIKERLFNPEYQNFHVNDKAEDTLLELFDVFYERHHIFLYQRWLGYTMMQDPFDMIAIQQLLFEIKPDLIIETGTANGGSALLWASILEVGDMHSARIHTIDPTEPKNGFGSTDAKKDPTAHRLWAKYITFHKGYSTEKSILANISEAARQAKTVLVLLDSDHSQGTVAAELEAYCMPFVTLNSYCIVQDTKMSRMSPAGGPLAAVKEFLGKNQDFTPDRDRELKYTQHVMGYLKRVKDSRTPATPPPPAEQGGSTATAAA